MHNDHDHDHDLCHCTAVHRKISMHKGVTTCSFARLHLKFIACICNQWIIAWSGNNVYQDNAFRICLAPGMSLSRFSYRTIVVYPLRLSIFLFTYASTSSFFIVISSIVVMSIIAGPLHVSYKAPNQSDILTIVMPKTRSSWSRDEIESASHFACSKPIDLGSILQSLSLCFLSTVSH